MVRYLPALLSMLSLSFQALATHIVGGDMSYRCLGGNKFEVKLSVYRDCYYGIPPFDNPGCIGIFSATGSFIDSVMVPVTDISFLTSAELDSCTVLPGDVCVERGFYIDTLTLPFIAGGYILAYQRCCRNNTINNLVLPGNVGITITVNIPESALLSCNNSPYFNQWPPTFICAGKAINFDHSATDIDSDSVAYRLCTPLTGGSTTIPTPLPPSGPPYAEVPFASSFSESDMLGNPITPLTINPITGMLTGVPTIIGQFVVGVCADEYRNGQLVSTLRRDFQYNVRPCFGYAAVILSDTVVCNGSLQMLFQASTTTANAFNWRIFNLDTIPIASFNGNNWLFTFSNYGTYLVRLIAQPGTSCADTTWAKIVLYNAPSPAISLTTGLPCSFQNPGQEIILSTGVSDTTLLLNWSLEITSPSYNFDTLFNVLNVVYPITEGGLWQFKITVRYKNGCVRTAVTNNVYNISPDLLDDYVVFCQFTDTLYLNPNANVPPNTVFQWSPANLVNDSSIANPYLISPSAGVSTFVVTVTVGSACPYVDTMQVVIPSAVFEITASLDGIVCSYPQTVSINANLPANFYVWAYDPTFLMPFHFGDTLTVSSQPFGTIYIFGKSADGCTDTLALNFTQIVPPEVTLNVPDISCLDTAVVIYAVPSDLQGYSYQWTLNGSSVTGSSFIVVPLADIAQLISVNIANANGCASSAEAIVPTKLQPDFDVAVAAAPPSILMGMSSVLEAQVTGNIAFPVTFQWSPEQHIDTSTGAQVVASPPISTVFTVTATDARGCTAQSSINLVVSQQCDTTRFFVPTAFSPNGDQRNDTWQFYGYQALISDFEVMVYDRWGVQVFVSNDPKFSWDGTFRGQLLPADVYGFVVRVACGPDDEWLHKGNLTILK